MTVTEDELKASAAETGGKRVTLDLLNANIQSIHTFTARAGAENGNGEYDSADVDIDNIMESLGLLTIAVIVLKNGFTVLGQSACADPANFNPNIGQRLAIEDAKNKIWALMGYHLKQTLHEQQALLDQRVVSPEPGSDMDVFIGTKVVNARPMNRLAYNELRGWKLPEDENGNDAGYLVEYTDKLDNHVAGFKGYVSWSPKDVFERAYSKI